MKSKLPKLPNGDIDLSKVDIHNDFPLFPPMFSSPNDIENFIKKYNLDTPVLSRILFLRKQPDNPLNLTDTEKQFYFDQFFDYIYDVFRVPVPETIKLTKKWIAYLENQLVSGGMQNVEKMAFNTKTESFDYLLPVYKVRAQESKKDIYKRLPIINCHHIKLTNHPEYYDTNNKNVIESFWIKTDLHVIQPEIIDNEAYARVHVYPKKVYIFGCDDCSWTLESKNKEEINDFVIKLKCCCPVWNFNYPQYIHKKLEFTN